jgi:uncharacterized membrane protein
MKQLVAIAYPDRETADRVREVLVTAAGEGLAQLEDAVVVERDQDGEIKLHQLRSMARAGAGKGALIGAGVGMLFLAPFLGAAFGAATGGLGGKLSDTGLDDTFVEDLGARLKPGAAAVVVLGTTEARDELIARVKPYGGEIFQTWLSFDDEQRLRAQLGGGEA